MIQIITGEKGKGKTRILLNKVNEAAAAASGNMVFLDKNTKKMFELNNKVRLINVREYLISNHNEFIGFISGIISQDHDLEQIYLDNFLDISTSKPEDVPVLLDKLNKLSETFHIEFIISISIEKSDIPTEYAECVIAAL